MSEPHPESLPPLPTQLSELHALIEAYRVEFLDSCLEMHYMNDDAAQRCLAEFEADVMRGIARARGPMT